jgi:hypothetical protein
VHVNYFANAVRDVVLRAADRSILDLVSFLRSGGQRTVSGAPSSSPGTVLRLFQPITMVSYETVEDT